LNNFVNDINWKASTIALGIGIRFNQNKLGISRPPTPPIPDAPKMPLPPKEIALQSKIILKSENIEIQNNDTLDLKLKSRIEIEEYSILPVMFYQRNSEKLLPTPEKQGIEYIGQESLLDPIISHLKDNQKTHLK